MYKFTIILEHNLKQRLPLQAHRQLMRHELCDALGLEGENRVTMLNQRCKSGKEPTHSQMKAMRRVFAKYGFSSNEIFDKPEGE